MSPELVEIERGGEASSRWQQPFDAEIADVFRVQGEIAGRVAEAMRVAVGGDDQARLAEVPTRNSAAYDAFLRAEAIWAGSSAPSNIRRGIAEYERAVHLDTAYAAAYAGLARARSSLYGNGVPTAELARQAREAADEALRLAPNAALTHSARSVYFLNVEYKASRAVKEMEAARAATPNDPELLARLAAIYMALGRFDEALRAARTAQQLDPRSVTPASRLQTILTWLRQYPEAAQAADQALALSPNATTIEGRVLVWLGEGDLTAARHVLDDAGTRLNQDELVTYLAQYWDLGWVLDDAGQRRVLALGPEQFDNDRADWAIVRAQVYNWRGDVAQARAWGDSAAREFASQIRNVPNDPQRHVLRGLALAYAGHRAEALDEASRGMGLSPLEEDYSSGAYYQHLLVRIHLLVGEPEKALDVLEPLLAKPHYLSPGWLRIDPTFASLKGNARFEKLIAGR